MKKILIATGNPGKKKEIKEALAKVKFDWLSLKDFPAVTDEPEENGDSFEANAIIKAQYYGEKTGQFTIAEDSGLILSAFPEKFGLNTKREIQAKTDIDWLRLFLDIVEPQTDRQATFYSAFGVYDPTTKKSVSFLGTTTGEIVDFPAAPVEKGIPVSAVFCPDGEIDVYSAMSKKKKTEVSHRGKAAKKLIEYLKTIDVSS